MNYRIGSCFKSYVLIIFCALFFVGCEQQPDQALGTLEWDRVDSRIPASEIITDINVDEGQHVEKGMVLLKIDDRKVEKQQDDLKARLDQASWKLKELEAGPLPQTIAEARARLEAAKSTMANDHDIYKRQKRLYETNFTSREQLDNAENKFLNSTERVKELTENLNKLLAGTRVEQVEQARSQVVSLTAQLEYLQLLKDDYTIKATRNGLVDSIPFKKGDRPPMQSVVCTLMTGDRPWARVYVPEKYRSTMRPGQEYRLAIDGQQDHFSVRLRTISSDSSFTPYFALSEKDRSRLSYVAKLDVLDERGRELTAGTPVQLILEKP